MCCYFICYFMNLHNCYVYKNRNTYKTNFSNSLIALSNCCAANVRPFPWMLSIVKTAQQSYFIPYVDYVIVY